MANTDCPTRSLREEPTLKGTIHLSLPPTLEAASWQRLLMHIHTLGNQIACEDPQHLCRTFKCPQTMVTSLTN